MAAETIHMSCIANIKVINKVSTVYIFCENDSLRC